ncbi:hypothetical protein Aduo_012011 [Ancylostoma duodenale]
MVTSATAATKMVNDDAGATEEPELIQPVMKQQKYVLRWVSVGATPARSLLVARPLWWNVTHADGIGH